MIKIEFHKEQVFLNNKENGGCFSFSEIIANEFRIQEPFVFIDSIFCGKPFTYKVMKDSISSFYFSSELSKDYSHPVAMAYNIKNLKGLIKNH